MLAGSGWMAKTAMQHGDCVLCKFLRIRRLQYALPLLAVLESVPPDALAAEVRSSISIKAIVRPFVDARFDAVGPNRAPQVRSMVGELLGTLTERANLPVPYDVSLISRNGAGHPLGQPFLERSRAGTGAIPYRLFYGDSRLNFVSGRAALPVRPEHGSGPKGGRRAGALHIRAEDAGGRSHSGYRDTLVVQIRSR